MTISELKISKTRSPLESAIQCPQEISRGIPNHQMKELGITSCSKHPTIKDIILIRSLVHYSYKDN